MDNPTCPICGSPTKLQTAKKGRFAGQQFYGCIRYPQCKGLINIADNQTNNSNNISNNGNLKNILILYFIALFVEKTLNQR